MAAFNSSKFFTTEIRDISAIMNNTKAHFEEKGYEVTVEGSSFGGFISLSKGGIFKAVLGMKTSLNVEIKVIPGGIKADAKVGIFGQQAIPALISWFVAWPVLLTQITGLVQQAKLDDEVLDVIGKMIEEQHKSEAAEEAAVQPEGKKFCVSCGAEIEEDSAFCPICGAKQS